MVREGRAALNEFVTIGEAVRAASIRLDARSESPRLDAELLLARAIDTDRSYVLAHPEVELDPDARARFDGAITKRAGGMPMAYITGIREFWSMELVVTPATLVPRPETELLVEHAIGCVPRRRSSEVLDLGTGSGAVALAIARERPLANVVASDSSAEALCVAAENVRRQDVANVEFREGDWCEPVRNMRFDVIAANPPYVAEDDPALEALRFEPRAALVAGRDGLDAIRRLVVDCPEIANADAALLIEHGATQADAVAALFADAGWCDIRTIRDLAGLPRVTLGRRS